MPLKFKLILGFVALALMNFQLSAMADESAISAMAEKFNQQFAKMQEVINKQNIKIEQQDRKISDLESRPTVTRSTVSSDTGMSDEDFKEKFEDNLKQKIGSSDQWLKDLKFFGDYRLRYEGFNYTRGLVRSNDDARNRFRMRLRFGFEKKIIPDVKVGFALASGAVPSSNSTTAGLVNGSGLNNDPTSTNSTFTNSFNFKNIFIERAWATYKPLWAMVGPITEFEVTAGKFTNPFEAGSSKIIWDTDVRPEGAYEKVDLALIRNPNLKTSLSFIAGQYILTENTTFSAADSELYAYQAQFSNKFDVIGKPVEVLNAASFYDYSDYAVNNNWQNPVMSGVRGNTNVDGITSALDAGDFNIIDIYNEVKLSKIVMGKDIKGFFDVAKNVASNVGHNYDLAWALGAKVGSAKKKGEWEVGYEYRYIEPDATVGNFSDSDFGDGHNNKRGSVFTAGYALSDNMTVNAAAYFVNNIIGPAASVNTGDVEQRRFQVDMNWKFG